MPIAQCHALPKTIPLPCQHFPMLFLNYKTCGTSQEFSWKFKKEMEEEMSHLFHELSHLQEGGITHFHFTFISFSSLSAFLGGKRERKIIHQIDENPNQIYLWNGLSYKVVLRWIHPIQKVKSHICTNGPVCLLIQKGQNSALINSTHKYGPVYVSPFPLPNGKKERWWAT